MSLSTIYLLFNSANGYSLVFLRLEMKFGNKKVFMVHVAEQSLVDLRLKRVWV